MKINIVIKGYYEKPEFPNRFTIEWPFSVFPSIGHYVDIKEFISSPDERMQNTYIIDMIQWSIEGPYIMLIPIPKGH
jgi:hypothetical protein